MFRSAVLCASLFLFSTASMGEDITKTVKFPKGATSTTLKGTIRGGSGVNFVFEGQAGQTLQTLFSPSNRSCYFNVFEPNSAEAAHIGSTSGNEFGKTLTKSGVYRAQVYLMRNAARRGETCRYSLSIEISGAPGGVSAGISDLDLQDRCKGEAAGMYGVEPRNIAPGAVKPGSRGFQIDAKADKGKEGIKMLRCIFKSDRSFDHIMAMTSDRE